MVAAFLDMCCFLALYFVLAWLGEWIPLIHDAYLYWTLPVCYLLIRDMSVGDSHISVGKRMASLTTVPERGQRIDFVRSLQRNILFFLPPVALCMAGLELYLIIRSKDHRRFGDYFAKTTVAQRVDL